MRRRAAAWAAAVLAALCATAAGALSVSWRSPEHGVAVFGRVTLEAEVGDLAAGTAVRLVVFYLDGEEVGRRAAPPYRLEVDLGDQNRGHRFEVLAHDHAGGQARAVLETPAIRVDLAIEAPLAQLYVTVTRRDALVLDRRRHDFTVIDDGRAQTLVTFERGDVPLTALVLLDASESMRGARLDAALAGARAFFASLHPLDQAQLILFADRVLHETPVTSFAEVLATGLDTVEASGGTALNDHLYLALNRLEGRQGRRLAILLSDGFDIASALSMHQVLDTVRRSSALVYWLRLGLPDRRAMASSAWRDAPAARQELRQLEAAVDLSGGRVVTLASIDQAGGAFKAILEELRGQYVLGYYPSVDRDDGRWHPLTVRVRGHGLRVRAREGYVDR